MPDYSKVYSAIGAVLNDDELDELIKKTGKRPSDIFGKADTLRVKVAKTIEKLRKEGNERWVLTWILIHAVDDNDVRQAIIETFPKTLIRLPSAEEDVMAASNFLLAVLNIPFTEDLRRKLLPKRRNLNSVTQNIVALFAYKSLHEYLLRLLTPLDFNDAALAEPTPGVDPDLAGVVELMNEIVKEAPVSVALVGRDVQPENTWIAELQQHSAALTVAIDKSDTAASIIIIDAALRLVRDNLLRLNKKIFAAVQGLSFDALTRELPSNVMTRNKFTDLVQAVSDVRITVLARAFKTSMWQDAEKRMSLLSNYFEAPDDSVNMADEWWALRDRVDWLTELEPDEQWSKDARRLARDIDDEFSKEEKLDPEFREHFEKYEKWFRGPFKKIDDTLKVDCGALRKMDLPLKQILDDLTR